MTKRLPLLFAAVGILLRIIPVWAVPTWYDENFTILVSRLPLARLIAATAGDVHPPLYYLICWPLAHIPGMPAWMVVRLPAVLFGIAAIWVWWRILEIMTFRSEHYKTRLAAFGLFCLLPQQVFYSQEGRMYSLLTLLVLAAWLCILQRRWIWLGLVTALMLWTHNYGLFYAAALWLAALFHDRRTWRPLTISLTAAGLTFVPWVLVLLGQMRGISGRYWMVRFNPVSILNEFEHSFFINAQPQADFVFFAVFYGLLVWALIWALRRGTVNLPAVILAFVPLTLAGTVSVIWQPVMLFRALIPSAAFVALLLVQPVESMGRRSLLLASVFLAPVLFANLGSITLRYRIGNQAPYVDGYAISIVDTHWQPGDLLYYVDDGTFVSGSVNWRHIDNALQVETCGPVLGGLSQNTQDALGMRSGSLPDPLPGRVWVISADTPLNPTCMEQYLESHGLVDTNPLYCAQDNALVKSCVYLEKP